MRGRRQPGPFEDPWSFSRCDNQGRSNVPAEWAVTLHDRLPAYITWQQYLRNTERLRQNRTSATTRGAARPGITLLCGLVYCGRCGRRKGVLYSATSRPRYE